MRLISLFLALFLCFCGTAYAETAAPEADFSDWGIVHSNLGQVNLRAKASASSARVALLQNYDMAHILGAENGDDGKIWYHVEYDGREGYIHGDYFDVLTKEEYALRTGIGTEENAPSLSWSESETPENLVPPAYPVPHYVNQLLFIAEKEVGYTEESSGVTKYGIWSGDSKAEWCAEYLCWCTYQTDRQFATQLFNNIYPNYTGNNTGRDWFLQQGRYVSRRGMVPGWGSQWFKGESTLMEANSYIPQPGDWLFLATGAEGDTSHVAMVTHCTYNDDGTVKVHVLEGNNPSAVQKNTYALDYWAILGYGTVHDVANITLKEGNKGEKVRALQTLLCSAGYFREQNITGTFGDITLQAVKQFQQAQGLVVTGIADLNTQLLLEEMAKTSATPAP